MLADLDLLLTAVFCTADDLLPARQQERQAKRDRRGGRHALRSLRRSWTSDRIASSSLSRGTGLGHLFPEAASAAGLLEASRAAGRHDRVADRAMFARDSPGLLRRRRAAGLHAGRVRPLGRYRAPLRLGAGLRASLQPQPPAGFGACACICWPRRTARHAPRSSPRPIRRSATSRCGCSRSACTAASWSSATRATPAASFDAQAAERFGARILRPARKNEPGRGPVHLPDPPADRVDLPDAQRPPRPGTTPRPHPARTSRTNRDQTPGARRRRLAQPLPRPAHTRLRRARRLAAPRNQSSDMERNVKALRAVALS